MESTAPARRRWAPRLLSVLAVALLGLALSATAFAEREHVVRPGQSLNRIARRYAVPIRELARANGLRVTANLRPGQVLRIPEAGYHYVQEGETLSSIARLRETTVRALRRANDLGPNAVISVGQRLLLPGFISAEERDEAAGRWGRPRAPGVGRFLRMATDEQQRFRLVDGRRRVRQSDKRHLTHLLRDHRSNERKEPPQRLVANLARISDHFGGRRIVILSGYRPAGRGTRDTSRHVAGAALDMRIEGVPNAALRDYLRGLERCGVGWYPNSTFVHFDVRDRKAYWVDRSRRNED